MLKTFWYYLNKKSDEVEGFKLLIDSKRRLLLTSENAACSGHDDVEYTTNTLDDIGDVEDPDVCGVSGEDTTLGLYGTAFRMNRGFYKERDSKPPAFVRVVYTDLTIMLVA